MGSEVITRFARLLRLPVVAVKAFVRRGLSSDIRLAHDQLHLALKSAASVGWDWDVNTGQDTWFGDLTTTLGLSGDTYHGKVEDFRQRVHPDDRDMVWKAVAHARKTSTNYNPTFRIVREDGTVRWLTANGRFYYGANGEAVRMLGIAHDITERTRIENAHRAGEASLHVMADIAPVMIRISGPDTLCGDVNRPWLEFTGRSKDALLGSGWADALHADDTERCLKTYSLAFERREPFRLEYRLQRRDGLYRHVLETGVPTFAPGGAFTGYVSSSIDVTEHKAATDALSRLSRKLMEHHESERITIAQELHDEIGERLALLTVELEHLNQFLAKEPFAADVAPHVRTLCERAVGLGQDIQAISHRLHSSKLDFVGITVAASECCKDMCNKRKVSIDFSHEGIPRDLPKAIALCLFRVLQEALDNGVTHARVSHFTVTLCGTPNEIQLEVADKGIGFDLATVLGHHALGLIGMKERISMVNGEIVFDSRPGEGTTVRACVPLGAERSEIFEREQIKFLRCDGPGPGDAQTM